MKNYVRMDDFLRAVSREHFADAEQACNEAMQSDCGVLVIIWPSGLRSVRPAKEVPYGMILEHVV